MSRPRLSNDPGAEGFVLAAVVQDATVPQVFTVLAYQPDDLVSLLTEQFPGQEARMLSQDVLSEHAQAEVRALLELAASEEQPDGVIVGTTDGRGGWASWNLGFFAPKPGPVPDLPERQ